jgi:NADPH:quinone reductase-like Zn-dependent oxidoreductase
VIAAVLESEGDADAVRIDEAWADPTPAPGEAVVRLSAASLNHLDVWVRRGLPSVPLPRILGADGVGVVASVGAATRGVAVGDRVLIDPTTSCGVCAWCLAGDQPLCPRLRVIGEQRDGTHAQLVCVPARNLHRPPRGLSDAEAASLGLVFATAWRMLVTRANLRAGEWVLVWGVGGGVATAALALARACGARVIVTSSSDEKLDRARSLGAEVVVRHDADDVVAVVEQATAGRGADVVVETVGEATWQRSLRACARGGRVVVCGATSGGRPPARLHQLFYRQVSVLGSTMCGDAEFRQMLRVVDSGAARPVVDCVMPLTRAADAHRRLEQGAQMGKIVLEIPQ